MTMKISLAVIAKNEEMSIGKMLKSVKEYVDEIIIVDTGSTDNTKSIAEGYGATVYDFEWVDDFSAARNFSFSKCTGELILWLDCDDELIHGENLRAVASEIFDDPRNGGMFMIYQYAFDDYGLSIMEHWKMRLMRNEMFQWKGAVHEDPLPLWETGYKKVDEIWVKHDKKVEDVVKASDRNLRILLKDYEKDTENPDPRTVFYLANTYLGLHEDEKAIEFYEMHQESSGWNEEKYVGLNRMADCLIRQREFVKATDIYLRGIKLMPDWPDAYFGMAQCYLAMKNYVKVEIWSEMGFKKSIPDAQVLMNPRRYDLYPMQVLEDAYMQQGKYAHAIPVQQKIIEFIPDNKEYHTRLAYAKDCIYDTNMIKTIKTMKKHLDADGDTERLEYLAKAVPEKFADLPSIARLMYHGDERSDGEKKEVCIYCGPSHELWSPRNIETGIGGSEEAVINISKELTELGYLVTVYSFLPEGEEGDYDGVLYKNFWEYRKEIDNDKHWDIVILWRSTGYIDGYWNCDQLYVWLHDMQEQVFFTEERIDKVDKFFVLSEFHRKNVSFIPDEKVFVTANGIDPSHFEKDLPRNPHRVIYSSSPDRGLDNLLSCWDDIKAAVPEAELHIYYGFTPVYDSLYQDNPKMMKFKKDILSLIDGLKDRGVYYHGRVGHKELADEMLMSGVWAYPTCFPEISCITAMKCQAAGAIPVVSAYAALNETVQYGAVLDTPVDEPVMHEEEWRNEFTQAMIEMLDKEAQDKVREKMMKGSREYYTWTRVAKQWDELFQNAPAKEKVLESTAV